MSIPVKDVFMALAEGKVVVNGCTRRYRLKDDKLQNNNDYTFGNWKDMDQYTPFVFENIDSIESEVKEHYNLLDMHQAIDWLLRGYQVVDERGAFYFLDTSGEIVRSESMNATQHEASVARLSDLKNKKFYLGDRVKNQ